VARIALVERRPDVASLGRAVLLGRGHAVESFEGLGAALERLRGAPPDAVVAGSSDPPAPRPAETVKLVRNLGPNVVALLLVPGRGDERVLLEGLEAGADEVVLVPFKPADLAGRVAAALQRVQARHREAPTAPGRPRPVAGPAPDLGHDTAPYPLIAPPPDVPVFVDDPKRLSPARVSAYAIAGDEERLRGALFDEYRLVRTIGVGGMGVVLEAVNIRTARPVALKILREDIAGERDAALRFLREAYVLQGIDDRNVIRIEDIGRSSGRLFYAMELVKGENLAQLLDREGKLAPAEACRIGAGVARALAALARRGIIHRDVKPGNVFLGTAGEIKLGDFGLAKRAFARCVTPVREPLGTPHYLAPEVIENANATPVSDIYSLGVVLHEMLSGSTPYDGRDTMQLLYNVCQGPSIDVAVTLERAPDDLRMVVAKALARDPKARWTDAAALAKALERCRMRMR
jgi:CheY-like chemotaxis protein